MSSLRLALRKAERCCRVFGLRDMGRRVIREMCRAARSSDGGLDVSRVVDRLCIGAAPNSQRALDEIVRLGLCRAIDLRAERKAADIFVNFRVNLHLKKQVFITERPIQTRDWGRP